MTIHAHLSSPGHQPRKSPPDVLSRNSWLVVCRHRGGFDGRLCTAAGIRSSVSREFARSLPLAIQEGLQSQRHGLPLIFSAVDLDKGRQANTQWNRARHIQGELNSRRWRSQDRWLSRTNCYIIVFTTRFGHSTGLDWGLYGAVICCRIPQVSAKLLKSFDKNWVPLSVIMTYGAPYRIRTSFNLFISFLAVAAPMGDSSVHLLNRSCTTTKNRCPQQVRGPTKSAEIVYHGPWGFRKYIFPASLAWSTLYFWQITQVWTYCLTCCLQQGQK